MTEEQSLAYAEAAQAYTAAAQWAGVPVRELTRAHVRKARAADVVTISERQIDSLGGHRALVMSLATPVEPIPDGHYVKGVSTLVDPQGRTVQQWVKTAKGVETREEVLTRLLETLPPKVTPGGKVPRPKAALRKDLLAVYPMGDPHLGMYSWFEETGDNFDLEEAEKIMLAAIDHLVTQGHPAEQALVVNLGDFFHSDNQSNKTNRSGHHLDVDGRWSKVLRVGLSVMVHIIIKALSVHNKVRVINEIGNHDDHTAIVLSVALDAYFKNEPRVEIDMSPAKFHYHRFGSNLIGVTHGNSIKHQDLEAIMATDKASDWGQTKHRFWYCGHIHTTRRLECRGCLVETFRTLSPRDAWTHESGYRAGRDMNRIVLHREYGEIERSIVSAEYLQSQYKTKKAKGAS